MRTPLLPAPPPPACRWARACQTIFLRSRTSAIKHSQLGQASPLDAVVAVPLSLVGPQASLRFASSPATPLRPAAADLAVEVGQMLAYVRIKQQASMTAFATQLTQITDALAPEADVEGDGAEPTPAPSSGPSRTCTPEPPPSPKALPRLQKALKVRFCVRRLVWAVEKAGGHPAKPGPFLCSCSRWGPPCAAATHRKHTCGCRPTPPSHSASPPNTKRKHPRRSPCA